MGEGGSTEASKLGVGGGYIPKKKKKKVSILISLKTEFLRKYLFSRVLSASFSGPELAR